MICRAEQPSRISRVCRWHGAAVVWFAGNPQPSPDQAVLFGPFPRMLAQMAACLSVSCLILNMSDLALRESIQSQLMLVGAQTGFTPSPHRWEDIWELDPSPIIPSGVINSFLTISQCIRACLMSHLIITSILRHLYSKLLKLLSLESHKFPLVKYCPYSAKPRHWHSSSVSTKGLGQALKQINVDKWKI